MQRLERRHRLTQKAEFDRVLRGGGKKVRAGPLRIVIATSMTAGPRLGVVVPKRHLRLAVRRNKLKRVIRESFRLASERLPPLDVVVMLVCNPGANDVRGELDQAWSKLSLASERTSR